MSKNPSITSGVKEMAIKAIKKVVTSGRSMKNARGLWQKMAEKREEEERMVEAELARDQEEILERAREVKPERVKLPDHKAYQDAIQNRTYAGFAGFKRASPPEREEFVFSPDELCNASSPLQEFLVPLPRDPSDIPPPNREYPQSPIWKLQQDNRWSRGYIYAAPYYLSQVEKDFQRMERLSIPPQTTPIKQGRRYISQDIPGCVRLVAGVPVVWFLQNDPDRAITVACLQTLNSLKSYPDYEKIEYHSIALAKTAWGCDEFPRLSRLHGMKTNDRSPPQAGCCRDGSYSLAGTVMKGEGVGNIVPAVQANTPDAAEQIATVLHHLNQLFRLIMPKCLSKLEMELFDFHHEANNIFSFGGLDPNGTSCQFNVSSHEKDLKTGLGRQGSLHTDLSDDPTARTLFILSINAGPDADPGLFLLGRPAVYIRERGCWILFLVFNGNDLHSGFAPQEDDEARQEWIDTVKHAWDVSNPENRMGFVIYSNKFMTQRTAGILVTPATHFGNGGTSPFHRKDRSDWARNGVIACAGRTNHANLIGRELFLALNNGLCFADLRLKIDINHLLQNTVYTDENGIERSLLPLRVHPELDRAKIDRMWALYEWYRYNCLQIHIEVKRWEYKAIIQGEEEESRQLLEDAFTSPDFFDATASRKRREDSNSSAPLSGKDAKNIIGFNGHKTIDNGEIVYIAKLKDGSTREIPDTALRSNPLAMAYIRKLMPRESLIFYDHGVDISTVEEADGNSDQGAIFSLSPPRTPSPSPSRSSTPVELSPTKTLVGSDMDEASSCLMSTAASTPSKVSTTAVESLSTLSLKRKPSTDDMAEQSPSKKRRRYPSSLPDPNSDGEPSLDGFASDEAEPPSLSSDEAEPPSPSSDEDEDEAELVLDEPSSSDETDGHESEVEDIIRHKWTEKKEVLRFQVLWKSTGKAGQWYPEEKLDKCEGLLEEYKKAQLLTCADPEELKDIPITLKRPKHGLWPQGSLLGNLTKLEHLVDAKRLEREIIDFARTAPTDMKQSNVTPAEIYNRYQTFEQLNHRFETLLFVSSPSPVLGLDHLARISSAARLIDKSEQKSRHLDLATRLNDWESAQTYILFWEWFSKLGSQYAEQWVKVYLDEGGLNGLAAKCGLPLANVVNHAIHYTYASMKSQLEAKRNHDKRRKKRKKVGETPVQRSRFEDVESKLGPAPSNLDLLPEGMYGLQKGFTFPIPLNRASKLRGRVPKSRNFNEEVLGERAAQLVENACTYGLILPYLQFAEASSNSKKVTTTQVESTMARAISRGAVLSAIADACGTSSIFSSYATNPILQSPTTLFVAKVGHCESFARWVMKNGTQPLKELRSWLRQLVEKNGADRIRNLANQLAKHVHGSLQRAKAPRLLKGPSPATKTRIQKKLKKPTLSGLTPEMIVHAEQVVDVLPIALILREALSNARGQGAKSATLQRILLGQHSALSAKPKDINPDHTNPIRHTLVTTTLLRKHIPGKKLTTPAGISNLLSWLGTGQGYKTSHWLSLLQATSSGFFAENKEEMMEMFESAIRMRFQTLAHQDPRNLADSEKIVYEDMRAYGTACNHLAVQPNTQGQKMSLEGKFGPYFATSVQQTWCSFLGAMQGQDPNEYQGIKHTWLEAKHLLTRLNISGFRSGLTQLQFCNSLFLLGVVTAPDAQEMGLWIFRHPTLGAFHGLSDLGFNFRDNLGGVCAAFEAVYTHLDTHLPDEDKKLLQLSPVLLEHVLCKVVRYIRLAKVEGNNKNLTWEDLKGNDALPFPTTQITTVQIQEAIKVTLAIGDAMDVDSDSDDNNIDGDEMDVDSDSDKQSDDDNIDGDDDDM